MRTSLSRWAAPFFRTFGGAKARQKRSASRGVPMAALEQRVLLASIQNFDGLTAPALPSGWSNSTSGTVSATWESFSTGGVGNSGHVFLAGPSNVNDTTLTTPSIAIHAANTQLKFQHSYNTEDEFTTYGNPGDPTTAYDGGVLEISINGGAFVDIVAAGGTFVQGGYNKSISSGFGSPLGGRQAWGGNSGGFVTTVVNLPASAIGTNIRLHWRYASDNDVASPGWGIDSIELNDTDPDDQISEATLRSVDTTFFFKLGHTRDVGMYAFDVTAGQTLAFDLDFSPFSPAPPMTDSVLRLFDAAGTQLAINDDANAPGESASPARESFIRHTFATAGRFYVGVSAFSNPSTNSNYSATTGEGDANGTNSGGYSLRIERTPTVTVTMADTALKVGETSLVTFTFSEAVTGFANADVTVENGTLSTITQVGSSNAYTATFTPNANITDTTNLITVTGAGFTDSTLNPGVNTSSPNYTIDTARPTATITMADTALKIGETSLVTFTFSEALAAGTFTNADFIVIQNGTLSAVTQVGSTNVWTATFTPNANITDTTNVIGLNLAGVTDLAGNAGVGGVDSPNYTIDTARPTIVSMVRTTPSTALTNATTVTFTATFSEAVTGVDLADFGTLGPVGVGGGSVSGSGAVYTVTLTGLTGSGQKGLALQANATFADLAGNSAVVPNVIAGEAYTIDQTRPTVAITMSDTVLSSGETSLVTFTFSEAVTGFTNADLTVQNGTLTAVASANGITWTGTFTPTANILDTTNVITLANTGVTDLAGNTGTGTTNSPNYTIETFALGIVQLLPDPEAPGQQMLLISGTNATDTISVAKAKGVVGGYVVTFNGVKSPTLVPTSRIFALGRDGNDKITIGKSIPIATRLEGGRGLDTLTGSSGPDVLIGGDDADILSGSTGNNLMFGEAGNDKLTGAGVLVGGLDNDTLTPTSSRSIAIGGLGADLLKSASKKGDILIGGTTNFDTNETALRALHSEWASANPIQVRIDHLAGLLPGGANGSTFLISDAIRPGTVHNDGVNDTFTNAFADDWLMPFAGDIRTKIIGRVNHA